MARWGANGADRVYAVAERWVDECLRRDGSLFTQDRSIWTLSHLEDLHRRFNESPDESAASFEEKFRKQLDGAPDETIQLAAEVMYVHLLIASDFKGQTKRKSVKTILDWAQRVVGMPPDLDAVLDFGVCSTGQGYKMYKPNQLWFLIDFARTWKSASADDRTDWLSDAWSFKSFLWTVPINSAYLQRNALLHLVFPDAFESTIAPKLREQIADTFRSYITPGTDDIDRQLLQIREHFTSERGPGFEFWTPDVVQLWNPKSAPAGPIDVDVVVPSPTTRRAWLVRGANVDGDSLIAKWLREGFCSIGWYELGDVPDDISRDDLIRRIRQTWPDYSDGAVYTAAGNLQRFLSAMQVGDLVLTVESQRVYVGEIATNAYWTGDDEQTHGARNRDVRWLNANAPFDRAALPPRVYSKLRALLTVSDLTDVVDDVEGLLAGQPLRELRLAPPTAELAARLHCNVAWLQTITDLLARKRQIIFYGPPGTGKTYIAQELADHLADPGGSTKLVQFHPSYAYEDFVEGYRPESAKEGVGFALLPGPFLELANAARQDPANPYVLIIDEINRANLAKVFGELYFLLEYRERAIDLQYSRRSEFTLPANLFVIGTMNTADRSIALVDAAMRRRFFFVSFFPQDPEIAGMLRSWLRAQGCSESAADLLDTLNTRIGDPDFAIGPSYLMTKDVDDPRVLDLIWRHSIMPLLEEHYYGQGRDLESEFSLTSLRSPTAVESIEQ